MHDVPGDVCQAIIAAGVMVGQLLVIETQQVKDGSVEVVNVHLVLSDFCSNVVGRTVREPAFCAASGEKRRESGRMVASALGITILPRCTAKFTAADNQRVIQETALPEILHQRSDRLVDVFGQRPVGFHVAVGVPVAAGANIKQLNHPNTPFHQTPRCKALPAKRFPVRAVHTIQIQRGLTFAGNVKCLGSLCFSEGQERPMSTFVTTVAIDWV